MRIPFLPDAGHARHRRARSRSTASLVVALGLLTWLSGSALAEATNECGSNALSDSGHSACQVTIGGPTSPGYDDSGDPAPPTPPPTPAPAPIVDEPPPLVRAGLRAVSRQEDGTTCMDMSVVWVEDDATATALVREANIRAFLDLEWSTAEFTGDCPDPTGEVVGPVTTEGVIAVFRDQVERPEPRIEPGMMITGLTAYLETDRVLTHQSLVTAGPPGNRATLEARGTATYMVDWGDGTVTGPHATPGAAHPHGTVTHIYTDTGTYAITVTDTWTMQWRFVGGNWTTPRPFTLAPVTLEAFEVQEYRAVRVTPGG